MKNVTLTLLALFFLAGAAFSQVSMVSEGGKFKATFPGEYSYSEQTIDTDLGPVLMHIYMYEEGDEAAYMISYNDYPADAFDQSLYKESLEGAKEGFTSNLGLEEEYSIDISMLGYPGVYFKATDYDIYATMYVIIRGNRLYQVGVLQQYYYADPSFLESFKLLE
ncbi:MAG: hypothetical protein ACOYXB_04900 [Bacteroidota bacterium]